MSNTQKNLPRNIVLIGAGIMSATLGILLRKLLPEVEITIFERLDRVAAESSDAWNNAGTGHSAFCELNYTPSVDGNIEIDKALEIAHQFEISRQLWAYLKESGSVPADSPFINAIPHMSFVTGEENSDFLKQRFEAMRRAPIFQDMLFSDDRTEVSEWVPLIMENRAAEQPFAVTKMDAGTDVNFGLLTHEMINHLERSGGVELCLNHEVNSFTLLDSGRRRISVTAVEDGSQREVEADLIFIGAGGGTLSLLEKTGIEEAQGYGGFPVSGHFLHCDNEAVIKRHHAKVYGKAAVGSPPMSVPHLDTRMIDDKQTLFFGPYAGFSTKFLKNGSYMDLPLSIESHNVWPILSAGIKNFDLAKYLVTQVVQSDEERFRALALFYPDAEFDEWNLITAGQRVQIIKKDNDGGGELKFGTEIVCAADGSVAALLGASPGASTSVSIMLEVLARLFPEQVKTAQWQQILKEMIPSYGESLIEDGELCLKTRARTAQILHLTK